MADMPSYVEYDLTFYSNLQYELCLPVMVICDGETSDDWSYLLW
jgi:hypothetical protein